VESSQQRLSHIPDIEHRLTGGGSRVSKGVNAHILKAIFAREPLSWPVAIRIATFAPGAERASIQAVNEDEVRHGRVFFRVRGVERDQAYAILIWRRDFGSILKRCF
jgi:hypothetical protein